VTGTELEETSLLLEEVIGTELEKISLVGLLDTTEELVVVQ